LLTIHHLAVDGVSWRVLGPDLTACLEAIAAGREPELGRKGTSFRRWAQRLDQESKNPARTQELAYWKQALRGGKGPVPEGLDPQRDTMGTAGRLSRRLPASVTSKLLTEAPAAFHAAINDVLLTGLYLSLARWRRRKGQGGNQAVMLDVEGHGREEVLGA